MINRMVPEGDDFTVGDDFTEGDDYTEGDDPRNL